ncbi:MAG: hypothetical protein AB7P03_30980, partial [Kofleriaceae bacterium]
MARDRVFTILLALVAGCTGETAQPPAAVTPVPAVSAGSANGGSASRPGTTTALASGSEYRVDAVPSEPCAPGARCELRVTLTALGDYKINNQYPTKFVPAADHGLALEGPGAFEISEPKRGVMTLALQRAPNAPATLRGTFKLSVCTDENCE